RYRDAPGLRVPASSGWTIVPTPCRVTTRPSSSSRAYAGRTVLTLISRSSAIVRTAGRRLPGSILPSAMRSVTCARIWPTIVKSEDGSSRISLNTSAKCDTPLTHCVAMLQYSVTQPVVMCRTLDNRSEDRHANDPRRLGRDPRHRRLRRCDGQCGAGGVSAGSEYASVGEDAIRLGVAVGAGPRAPPH